MYCFKMRVIVAWTWLCAIILIMNIIILIRLVSIKYPIVLGLGSGLRMRYYITRAWFFVELTVYYVSEMIKRVLK